MNETTTPYVERRPEGDGEEHECAPCGRYIGESTSHFVVDGQIVCVPCAENADIGV